MTLDNSRPPLTLDDDEVRDALAYISENSSEVRDRDLHFVIPSGYKNGKAQKFMVEQILRIKAELQSRLEKTASKS